MCSFQKICGNCHVADVTISTIGGVYCNACCSKSMVLLIEPFYFLPSSEREIKNFIKTE